jgi:hypothetical protein
MIGARISIGLPEENAQHAAVQTQLRPNQFHPVDRA